MRVGLVKTDSLTASGLQTGMPAIGEPELPKGAATSRIVLHRVVFVEVSFLEGVALLERHCDSVFRDLESGASFLEWADPFLEWVELGLDWTEL